MKQLFSSSDAAEISLMRSQLEAAGIPCEIRNESTFMVLPSAPFYPELWVLRDEDFAEARVLMDGWRHPGSSSAS